MSRPVPDCTELAGLAVAVAGAGAAGRSAADYLTVLGARVLLVDDRFASSGVPDPVASEAEVVASDGVTVAQALAQGVEAFDLMVVSPGFAPTHPLPVAAHEAGVPVWGEIELAWRVDRAGLLGPPRTWLVVTGTNGKTTTTGMVESIMIAAGQTARACGNYGLTVLDAMREPARVDVLCVEMSSFQLHWAPSVAADAGVVLNVAEDHLDWHGSFDSYAQAKAGALRAAVAVVGDDDAVAAGLPIGPDSRRVGFTSHPPRPGQLGVVADELVDAAFADPPVPLLAVVEVRPAGPSGVADALAAAALARAVSAAPEQVAAGLRQYRPAAHRGEVVAVVDAAGARVAFVDDSKATNPHAAMAALAAHDRVVLIAGGLLKGASVDELVITCASRLAGVVAIGRDRQEIVVSIARHAPEVPTVTVFTGDDGAVNVVQHPATPVSVPEGTTSAAPQAVMAAAVDQAWRLAGEAVAAGDRVDAVLLAPAAASLDMFASYSARGDAFAAAAEALAGEQRAGR